MTARTLKKPPQAPPLFTKDPRSVLRDVERLIEQSRKVQACIIVDIPSSCATFANTVLPLAQDENIRQKEAHVLEFYQHVSADEELRAASRSAESLLKDFSIETAMREDIFKHVKAVLNRGEELEPQSLRFLQQEERSYIRNGLGLPEGKERGRFKEIQQRLVKIAVEFRKNLGSETGGLWFSADELEGVPAVDLLNLEHGEAEKLGQFRVTFKYPVLSTVLQHATNSHTRRRLVIANANKVVQNVPLLKETLVLRHEAALMLGYRNHASFRLEEKMIKSPEMINSFLADLNQKLGARGRDEVENLKQLKRTHMESLGETFDGHYYMWDDKFYQRLMLESEFSVDIARLAEYFPLNTTLIHMLGIFENLFGMEFVEISGADRDELAMTGNGDDLVWHSDVRMFTAWNTGSDGEFLGFLYFDLHPREGKFGQDANFNLQPGFTDAKGGRSYPATALVCNFTKPTVRKPSLLKHDEVVVLFHELGHGIHDLVGRTAFARHHGTMCVVDFCEAPSQLLENWCWSAEPLKTLSQHYSTLSPEYLRVWEEEQAERVSVSMQVPEKITDDMIANLLRSRNVNSALFTLVTLHAATFDMAVHQLESLEAAADLNTSKIWNTLRNELMPIEGPSSPGNDDEWGHHEVTFGQLLGDYDAGIYGYLSSQMYSSDIFRSFFQCDPMSSTEGHRYRKMVLENGGSKDEMKMLEEYLGREPNPEAFYRELGLL